MKKRPKPLQLYKMSKQKIVYNPRPLDKILLIRLIELRSCLKLKEDSSIPYAEVREKIGRNFSVCKQQIKELIDFLEYSGFISCSNKGIKLNYTLENEK